MTNPRISDDGPKLQEYVEVRFNLMLVAADKAEAALRERVDAVESASLARWASFQAAHTLAIKSTDDRFSYVERLSAQAEENTRAATTTAADTQKQHNVAQNEWRATLTDFRQNTPTRPEFDKLTSEMTALRLELSTKFSQQQGERTATKETKDDSKWMITTVVAVAIAAASVLGSLFLRPAAPTAPPNVVYVPAPAAAGPAPR